MTTFDGKPVLPHRPHLDHLRKQAKVRLTEMRAAQPDARLADAQFSLAREYGFSSWGTLRTEVFRRAATARDRAFRAGRNRPQRVVRYRGREHHDALLDLVTHTEPPTALFVPGAGTNVVILFVFVAILTSVWTFLIGVNG